MGEVGWGILGAPGGKAAWQGSIVWACLAVLQVSFSNVCVGFVHPALGCQWGRKEVTQGPGKEECRVPSKHTEKFVVLHS